MHLRRDEEKLWVYVHSIGIILAKFGISTNDSCIVWQSTYHNLFLVHHRTLPCTWHAPKHITKLAQEKGIKNALETYGILSIVVS